MNYYSEEEGDITGNSPKHPVQPLVADKHGTVRFKENRIVRFLLDTGPWDMNKLDIIPFSVEDREQFAQLIGYSLDGFGELDYVTDETFKRACNEVHEFIKEDERNENQ